eukprot:4564417-Amphidinium_carterae.1
MHLPHVGHPEAERLEVLHHAQIVSQGARCIIGCDANAQVGSLRNTTMAGADLLEQSNDNEEIFTQFLCERGLRLMSTYSLYSPSPHTFVHSSGSQHQMDFVCGTENIFAGLLCSHCFPPDLAYVSSDHLLVSCQISHVRLGSGASQLNRIGWKVPETLKPQLQHEIATGAMPQTYEQMSNILSRVVADTRPPTQVYNDPLRPQIRALRLELTESDDRTQLARRLWQLRRERHRYWQEEKAAQDIRHHTFPKKKHPKRLVTMFAGSQCKDDWISAICVFLR